MVWLTRVRERPSYWLIVGRLALTATLAALARAGSGPLTYAQPGPWPTILLDVGSAADAEPSAPAYLVEGRGLSARQKEGDVNFRTLDAAASLEFYFKPVDLPLDERGVPNQHAILTVRYRDVVDETNCYFYSSSQAYCRPRIIHRLDYGDAPQPHWHALLSLAGLADETWKESSAYLEASPWQTLRAIDGVFAFQLTYPEQLAVGRPLPIDWIALRFVSVEEFERLREADRVARGLRRSDYVESRTWERRPGDPAFVVYQRDKLERIFPNSVPQRSEMVRRLTALEVAGEAEPVSFAIYALQDLAKVALTVTDLRGRGSVIPREQISVQRVAVLDKRWGFSTDGLYGQNPWVLFDWEPSDQPAGTSRQAWLTIRIPKETPAGTYRGRVTVAPANAPASELELEVEVVAIDLEPPEAMPYLYHSPYLPGKYYATQRSIALRDMAEHGVFPIIYLDATIDPNTFDVDVGDIDEELAALEALGILPPEPRVGIIDNAYSLYRRLCPGVSPFSAPCPSFNQVYRAALRAYRAAFAAYSVTPLFSFRDEPGAQPEPRKASNYLNRLTQEIGLRTWVTYYPECERPLAGHQLVLEQLASDSQPIPPPFLDDPAVAAYWDFAADTADRSPYRHLGRLEGGASIRDGHLELPDVRSAMYVPHHPSLDLSEQATIAFWFRPTACVSGYAAHPLAKWSSTDDANYVFYFFGSYDGRYPENAGRLRWYAHAGNSWGAVSGALTLDCDRGMGRWYHVLWVYDAASGGTLYVNGLPSTGGSRGPLAVNEQPLVLGRFPGQMDEVLLLRRALSASEVITFIRHISSGYDQEQMARLSLAVTGPVSPTLTLAIGDELVVPAELESRKEVWLDGRLAWSANALGHEYAMISLPLPAKAAGETTQLEVRVTNGLTRRERLIFDFIEDPWRMADWALSTSDGSQWQYHYSPDPAGSLGPMDPYLDDRVYAMLYVSEAERRRTLAAGDSFSYYTTYPATQPVPLNNRFLHGIYGSALGATGIYVYAYGDSGPQPWDDCEAGIFERIGTEGGRRSQNNYQLALPSWQDRMYDTLAFEMLREGIEDSRLIATLRRTAREHPGQQAEQAMAYLDEILSRPSRDYAPRYLHFDAGQPIQWYADRSQEILTDLTGDATDFAFFDRFRRRILAAIVELVAAESRKPLYLPLAVGNHPLGD